MYVVLSGAAFGKARLANEAVAPMLRAAGVAVVIAPFDTHLKCAIIDNAVFVADTNFSAHGLIVQDDRATDRALLVRAMVRGETGGDTHLWTRKADALAAEARVSAVRATRSLDVSSESFGAGTAIYRVLERRARLHDRVRLLVAAREAHGYRERMALARLARDGVVVRVGNTDEKLAVDSPDAFFGSANATSGLPGQVEWGMAVQSVPIAAAIEARFRRDWNSAQPWAGPGSVARRP